MDNLGNVLAALIVGLIVVFIVHGDKFITDKSNATKAGVEACVKDPTCYVSAEEYANYYTAVKWLSENDENFKWE